MYHHMQKIKIDMRTLFDLAVKSVQPESMLNNVMEVKGNTLKVLDKEYKLSRNSYLVGFGKAVLGMAHETERLLHGHLRSGIVSVPEGICETMKNVGKFKPVSNSALEILEGAKNNLPDERAEEAAIKIAELAQSLESDSILIVLVSGGGSSLLPLPSPPITLEEKCQVIRLLSSKGADITELNCVRKKLSVLKGGGLAKLAYPTNVVSFILSDIIGDPLDLIASGPTVMNNDTPDAALNVLNKYGLLSQVPLSVQNCVQSCMCKDTKNQSFVTNDIKDFCHVQNVLLGSNSTAVSAVAKFAIANDYNPVVLSTEIQGNVSDVGRIYSNLVTEICKNVCNLSTHNEIHKAVQNLRQLCNIREKADEEILNALQNLKNKKRICLIAGGETTVVVKGNGRGGRNQELAMVFSRHMYENSKSFPVLENFHAIMLSAGTDGIDGPTDAAGAFGYGYQINFAKQQNLDSDYYERNNNSYNYYSKLNDCKDLIVVGHTGTNVMDIHIIIIQQIVNN